MRILLTTLLLAFLASTAAADTRLLRFPDLHGDKVAFTYAGDLWMADADGNNVRRLTSHPGQELFARFSPDGRHIAFTGQYDGGEHVYVIPVTGGEPKRLTWYPSEGPLPDRWGYDHQVYGWTPDGEHVLFRSQRNSALDRRLWQVPVAGGLPEVLPMPRAGSGDTRRTARPSCTHRCFAISAPGSVTKAVGPRTSTYTTSRATRHAR